MEREDFRTRNIEMKLNDKLYKKNNSLDLRIHPSFSGHGEYFLLVGLNHETKFGFSEYLATAGGYIDSKIKGLYAVKFKPRKGSIVFKYHNSYWNPVLGKYVYYYQTYEVIFENKKEWSEAVRYLLPFLRKKPKSNSKFMIPRKTVNSLDI